MSETIKETEQWKLGGNCEKCRRKAHCQKSCTARKRSAERHRQNVIDSVMYKMFGSFGLDYYH